MSIITVGIHLARNGLERLNAPALRGFIAQRPVE